MPQQTEFNGAITGHNVLVGLQFETGATMNNYFRDVDSNDQILNTHQGRVNYSLQKDRNQVCLPGTGHWFFHNPLYDAFQNGKGPQLLFVTAEAGGGKSTVMRTLADQLLRLGNASLVAYFFFKDDDDRLRSYDEALSGLIYQLLVQDKKLVNSVRKFYQQHGHGINHNTKAMWEVLSEIAVNAQKDVFCLLDAVDECEAIGRRRLVEDLQSFFKDPVNANSRLKFIASSRPYQDESHQYDNLFAPLTGNIRHLVGEDAKFQSDIRQVICSKAEELARKRQLNHSIQELLVERISAQNLHTRSFLAIRMAFELLDSHRRMHKGAGERTIGIILADIPRSLSEQFDKMLSKSLDQQHARRLFCVILAARRTIKIEEFKVIYSLTEPTDPRFRPPRSYDDLELPPDDEEFKQLVRSRCGLFITFVGNSVYLFHQTAREHLLARTESSATDPLGYPPLPQPASLTMSGGSVWKDSITSADANLVCAAVCLDLLNFSVLETAPLDAFDDLLASGHVDQWARGFASTRSFFFYAALNWHEHVTSAGDGASVMLGSTRYSAILNIGKPQFWAWFLIVASDVFSSLVRKRAPISSIWKGNERRYADCEYGPFLREACIRNMYPMDWKVRALLDTEPMLMPPELSQSSRVEWTTEDGFHLIDKFHLACGDYGWTSFNRAVHSIEKGNTQLPSLLLSQSHTPLSTLIWTSIACGAPHGLKWALSTAKDLSWLQNIPEHIIHRPNGHARYPYRDPRRARAKSYPPTFAVMLRTSTLPSSHILYKVLADWIDGQSMAQDFAHQVWESGGFIIPSLSRRLFRSGASINCELWQDGRTALQVAAAFWAHDAVQSLLEMGADSTKCTANGYNLLHWFFVHENVHDELDLTQVVVKKKSPIFRYFYQRSRIERTIRAMINSVTNKQGLLNQTCDKGLTPLMHAVKSYPSSTTAVKALLEQGADVDQRDGQGRAAMIHFFRDSSFASRRSSILGHLLHSGADPKATDDSGNSVLSYWARHLTSTMLGDLFTGFNAYNQAFHAIANISPLSQQKLLSEELKGLMIPLVLATRLGNAQMCLALLSAGVNPDDHGIPAGSSLTGNSGGISSNLEDLEWNPLMVALYSKAYVTAALLLENGANVGFKTARRDRPRFAKHRMANDGVTPLHVLMSSGSIFGYAISMTFKFSNFSRCCAFRPVAQVDNPTSNESLFKDTQTNLPELGPLPINHDTKTTTSDDPRMPLTPDQKKLQDKRDFAQKHFQKPRYDMCMEEDNSDSEYETIETVYRNDMRGADLMPYDTMMNIEGTLQTQDDLILSAIFEKDSGSAQRLEALVEFMISKGAPVNACTAINVTPLSLCAREGLSNVAEILLKHGADPNVADIKGCTPLMVAAEAGHDAIVECLLLSGADPDAQLRVKGPDDCKCGAVVRWGKYTYQSCDAPFTALAFAAERRHQRVVELLLRHGADPNLKIVHHVHGQVPSMRDKESNLWSPSSSEDELDIEPKQWKGYISIATALTWARGTVRNLLLYHGADPDKEEPRRECDCIVGKRKERRYFDSSDNDSDNSNNS